MDETPQNLEGLAKRKLQSRIGVKKELKRLPEQLELDEHVFTLASGNFEGQIGLLALTDRRLLFSHQGMFSDKVEEFPYDRISAIQVEKKMTVGKLKLSVAGGVRHEISNVMPKERVDEIASYIRQRISPPVAKAAPVPAPPVPAPPVSEGSLAEAPKVVTRLTRLGELRAQELITDESSLRNALRSLNRYEESPAPGRSARRPARL